jgi:uncharacterized protein (UPF0305 family)
MYKCDICGTVHEDITKYVSCVNACNAKERQKEALAKQLAEEQRQKKIREELDVDKANLESLQKQTLAAEEAFMKKHPSEPITLHLPSGVKVSVSGDYGFDKVFNWMFSPVLWGM